MKAIERVHLDVHRQQIAATVRAVLGVLAEKLTGATLADQTSKDIREGDDDGVDLAAFDLRE
ncbi:MAG: hypothetical protein U1F83_08940 [Verrucomicrobiota bacterium]